MSQKEYYVDGKRVSPEEFEKITGRALPADIEERTIRGVKRDESVSAGPAVVAHVVDGKEVGKKEFDQASKSKSVEREDPPLVHTP